MRICLCFVFLGTVLQLAVAVPGPWAYVLPWNPTVRLVTREAAKQLMGPAAFPFHIMQAGGTAWMVSPARWFFYRVDFIVGPWPRLCRAYIRYSAWGIPTVIKRWWRPWGRSMCW